MYAPSMGLQLNRDGLAMRTARESSKALLHLQEEEGCKGKKQAASQHAQSEEGFFLNVCLKVDVGHYWRICSLNLH